MALTDDQEKQLKEQLAAAESQLKELQEKQKEFDAKAKDDEKGGKPPRERPIKLDPDLAKDVQQVKSDIAEIKAMLGKTGSKKPNALW